MARKAPRKRVDPDTEGADFRHEPAPGEVMVRVTVGGEISDGQGGYFAVDARIAVTPEQAASLRAQDLAR